MKKLLLLWAMVYVFAGMAQTINFDQTSYVFGRIKEEAGKVEHVFTITNKGDKPLILQSVTASCGCTTPEWPRDPILPGKTAGIKVVFDPTNRGGNFDKRITVVSNATNGNAELKISGVIEARELKLEDKYRQTMGDLRFVTAFAAFTEVKNTESKSQEIEFVNTSKKVIKLEALNVPAFLKIDIQPSEIKPDQKGVIVVTFDGTKAKEFGYTLDYVNLKINGVADKAYRLMVSSTLAEDFSKLTSKQLADAPHASFEGAEVQDMGQYGKRVDVTFSFPDTPSGQKITKDFKFKNTGKSNLVIRNSKASCGCTTVEPSGKVIKPGATGVIKVVFDTDGRSGPQSKTVTLTLNDPDAPTVKLIVRGTLK
jgi:hypothetical protein